MRERTVLVDDIVLACGLKLKPLHINPIPMERKAGKCDTNDDNVSKASKPSSIEDLSITVDVFHRNRIQNHHVAIDRVVGNGPVCF